MMRTHARERGASLVVSLIFLLIFVIMALSIYRGTLTSAQAIGNMQWRTEAISAANETIDRLLSTPRVATDVANLTAQVNATPFVYDVNDDGRDDVRVSFPVVTQDGIARAGPRCVRAAPIPPSQLDPTVAADVGCFGSSTAGGIAVESGSGTSALPTPPQSLCSNTDWTMTVRATDPTTSTSVDVVQGYSARVPTASIDVCN
jgi:hypothetical protein